MNRIATHQDRQALELARKLRNRSFVPNLWDWRVEGRTGNVDIYVMGTGNEQCFTSIHGMKGTTQDAVTFVKQVFGVTARIGV